MPLQKLGSNKHFEQRSGAAGMTDCAFDRATGRNAGLEKAEERMGFHGVVKGRGGSVALYCSDDIAVHYCVVKRCFHRPEKAVAGPGRTGPVVCVIGVSRAPYDDIPFKGTSACEDRDARSLAQGQPVAGRVKGPGAEL